MLKSFKNSLFWNFNFFSWTNLTKFLQVCTISHFQTLLFTVQCESEYRMCPAFKCWKVGQPPNGSNFQHHSKSWRPSCIFHSKTRLKCPDFEWFRFINVSKYRNIAHRAWTRHSKSQPFIIRSTQQLGF